MCGFVAPGRRFPNPITTYQYFGKCFTASSPAYGLGHVAAGQTVTLITLGSAYWNAFTPLLQPKIDPLAAERKPSIGTGHRQAR
jgi:hypothetical protein